MGTDDRTTDADLQAFVDGALPPERAARMRARLAEDPALRAKAEDYARIDERLRAALAPVLDAPIPARLLVAAGARRPARGWLAGALAAGLVLGVAIGAWLAAPDARDRDDAIERAVVAHRIYLPEVRHPVEVAAAEREHLDRWLSNRLGHELKAPDLSPLGLALVGGRLLPDAGIPAAQFMYEDPSGERITIYCRDAAERADSALHYVEGRDAGLYHWLEGGMWYAVVAALPKERLRAIAEAAYRQL